MGLRSRDRCRGGFTVKALNYLGPAKKALQDRPNPPVAAATGAVIRISKSTIAAFETLIRRARLKRAHST